MSTTRVSSSHLDHPPSSARLITFGLASGGSSYGGGGDGSIGFSSGAVKKVLGNVLAEEHPGGSGESLIIVCNDRFSEQSKYASFLSTLFFFRFIHGTEQQVRKNILFLGGKFIKILIVGCYFWGWCGEYLIESDNSHKCL